MPRTIRGRITTMSKNETVILTRVKEYIIKTCNISIEEYSNNIKEYLRTTLKRLRSSNSELLKLRLKRKQLREDIEDLECSMVGGENLSPSEEGKNTGGRKNPPDFKMIQKLALKEELGKLVNESLLLEKSLKDNNDLIKDFIELLPNKNQQIVLDLTYLDCMSNTKISNQLFYTIEYVDISRNRAIKKLTALLLTLE